LPARVVLSTLQALALILFQKPLRLPLVGLQTTTGL
jgi:hypothetical protein